MSPRTWLKRALMAGGARASARQLVLADAAVSFLALGRWLDRRGLRAEPVVPTREDLFAIGARRMREGPALYLEFGVFEGRSMQWWCEHLDNPSARLVGFDSFEGLPQQWNEANPRGHFSTAGAVPSIDDPRVSFVKGQFQDTLPGWEAPAHDHLFVNVDADLYSAAAVVLGELRPLLRPGTLLYFDELAEREHELRAFDEFLDDTGMRFRVLGVSGTLSQWLFERVG